MRNFSILSIVLALLAAGFLWQKILVNKTPDRLPDPADYSSAPAYQPEEDNNSEECIENDWESSACEPEIDTAEQGEMKQQRSQGHDVMMKSFDDKYGKYKDQINGSQ